MNVKAIALKCAAVAALTLSGAATAGAATGHLIAERQGDAVEILATGSHGWLAVGCAGWHPYVVAGR